VRAHPAPRGGALGYRSNFTIYDQADQVRVVKDALAELDRDPKRFVPRGIHSQISNAKNQLIGPDEYASRVASFYDQTVADVYQLYQRKLFSSNAVDFDDLLMLTVEVLDRFPEAARSGRRRSATSSSTSTRTRTTRSTRCSSSWPEKT
jgi:Superfamily I DNA and RNA helicases